MVDFPKKKSFDKYKRYKKEISHVIVRLHEISLLLSNKK